MRTSLSARDTRRFAVASALAGSLVACSLVGGGSTPTAEETQAPENGAPATPRPIENGADVPGEFRDEFVGVGLSYPTDWEVLGEASGSGELLVIRDPIDPIVVFLESRMLEEGESVPDALRVYFEELAGLLSLTGLQTFEEAVSYRASGGADAWRSTGEGEDGSGNTYSIEVVATGREERVFFLTFLVEPRSLDRLEPVIEGIRSSLRTFEPSFYGVPREAALILAEGEPETFDPALWRSSADGVIGDLFSGLVQLGPDLRPIPDLAEDWDVSPDGTIYTFTLRQGVTFHNGEPFTADDVKYSWERACWPETGSETAATYLGDILGVDEVIAGETREIGGVRVVDDYTLEVTLEGPRAYFLAKLAYPTSWIVDATSVDQIEEQPVGTGPFSLVRRIENEVIIVTRNPDYHRGAPALEYIVYRLYPGPLLRLYEAGEIDLAYITEDLLERANDPSDPLYGSVVSNSELCTYYAVFDSTRPPFDELAVRQAFVMAVDREEYIEVVEQGLGVAADGLYPPGLPGYSGGVGRMGFDSVQARARLQQSSYGGPDVLPPITLTTSGAGFDVSPSAAMLREMWIDNLGVDVEIEQLDSFTFYDQIYAGNHGNIVLTGWCADYPDPENFADILFHTGSPQNFADFSDPELDALLEQARGEPDVEARLEMYREIEEWVVEQAPAVFLEHSSVYYTVVKPYVHGFVGSAIGIAQHMNLRIER